MCTACDLPWLAALPEDLSTLEQNAASVRRGGRVAEQDGIAEDSGLAPNDAPTSHDQAAVDDRPAGAVTLTVASMNLHCGFSPSGEPFDVGGVVSRLGASVIGLQETWTTASAADASLSEAACVMDATVLHAPLCTFPDLAILGLPPGSGPGQFGMAVLSALPVADYEVVDLGAAPGDSIPRLAQVVWLPLGSGVVLRLVNTHLTYRPFSPVQLWRLRRLLGGHDGPTVITGDLNMPRPVASLTAGYAPAVRGRTWPAERPLLQLDHILASHHLDCLDGTVLRHVGSDHLPVRARLRIRPPATPPAGDPPVRDSAHRGSARRGSPQV